MKNVHVLKTYTSKSYSWKTPQRGEKKRSKTNSEQRTQQYFCSAIAGGLGEDWFNNYVYDIRVEDSIVHRDGYCECGYMQ